MGSRQSEEEGSQLFARAGEVPVHRGLGTSSSSEPSAAMSQHGDDRGSNCCRLSGKVWLGFFCLVLPFSCSQGEGTEQGEPCWSLVTSVTGCIQRSLLTAWANNADVAQAVFSLSDNQCLSTLISPLWHDLEPLCKPWLPVPTTVSSFLSSEAARRGSPRLGAAASRLPEIRPRLPAHRGTQQGRTVLHAIQK